MLKWKDLLSDGQKCQAVWEQLMLSSSIITKNLQIGKDGEVPTFEIPIEKVHILSIDPSDEV